MELSHAKSGTDRLDRPVVIDLAAGPDAAADVPSALRGAGALLRERLPTDDAFIAALERVGASLAELKADLPPPEPDDPAEEPAGFAPETFLEPPLPEPLPEARIGRGWAPAEDPDAVPLGPVDLARGGYDEVPPPPAVLAGRRGLGLFGAALAGLLGLGVASTGYLIYRDGPERTVAALAARLGADGPGRPAPAETGDSVSRSIRVGDAGAEREARSQDRRLPPLTAAGPTDQTVIAKAVAYPAAAPEAPAAPRDLVPGPTAAPAPADVAVPIPVPPAAAPPPPPPAAAAPREAYSAEEAQALRERAEAYIGRGQIANARSVLDTLHRQGDAEATYLLATTYDPNVLQTWKVIGMAPDAETARSLYRQAAASGHRNAAARLARLDGR